MLGTACLTILPSVILAQGLGGGGAYGGSIPATFAITDNTGSNATLAGTFGDFGALTVGKAGMLNTATPLAFRLRSNAPYKLSAQVGSLVGMVDGTKSVPGIADQAIQTGDIGFGFTATVVQTGLSVSGGGTVPSRTDTIVDGFDVHAGWPTVSNGDTPAFKKTLNDIFTASTPILSGPRISTCGDNSSSDNFLVVTVGLATLPQYLTPATTFSGTVTFTIAVGV
jgi:hypothetical protein